MKTLVKRLLIICLVGAAVLPAPAAAAKASLVFDFGRRGGTIKPFDVKIFADGKVTVTGTVRRLERVSVLPQGLDALKTLTRAERFFSLPERTNCRSTVGGLATSYIRARVDGRDRTVSDYGGCNKRFVELFEVLKAMAGVSTAPPVS